MAKGTIEFSLPEEDEDFQRAAAALDLVVSLEEILAMLRRKLKHEELGEAYEEVEKVQKEIIDILECRKVIRLLS